MNMCVCSALLSHNAFLSPYFFTPSPRLLFFILCISPSLTSFLPHLLPPFLPSIPSLSLSPSFSLSLHLFLSFPLSSPSSPLLLPSARYCARWAGHYTWRFEGAVCEGHGAEELTRVSIYVSCCCVLCAVSCVLCVPLLSACVQCCVLCVLQCCAKCAVLCIMSVLSCAVQCSAVQCSVSCTVVSVTSSKCPTHTLHCTYPRYAIGGLAGGEDKDSFWRVVAHVRTHPYGYYNTVEITCDSLKEVSN